MNFDTTYYWGKYIKLIYKVLSGNLKYLYILKYNSSLEYC